MDEIVPPSARDQALDMHAHVDPVDAIGVEVVPRDGGLLPPIPHTHGVVDGAGEEHAGLVGGEANAANSVVVAAEVDQGTPGRPDIPDVDGTAGGGG